MKKNRKQEDEGDLSDLANKLIETLVFGNKKVTMTQRGINGGRCMYDGCHPNMKSPFYTVRDGSHKYSFHQRCIRQIVHDYLPVS